jgi:hypothetical protein
VKEQPAAGRGRIDRFRQRPEADIPRAEPAGDVDEVRKAAPEPVEFPGHEDIARRKYRERLVERRSAQGNS